MMGGKWVVSNVEDRETRREKRTGASQCAHLTPAQTCSRARYWLKKLCALNIGGAYHKCVPPHRVSQPAAGEITKLALRHTHHQFIVMHSLRHVVSGVLASNTNQCLFQYVLEHPTTRFMLFFTRYIDSACANSAQAFAQMPTQHYRFLNCIVSFTERYRGRHKYNILFRRFPKMKYDISKKTEGV